MSNFTFVPLSTLIGAEAAQEMIEGQKAKIQAQIDTGRLSKSLQAQYEVQLQRLESNTNGDCELIMFPGTMIPSCKLPAYSGPPPLGRGKTNLLSFELKTCQILVSQKPLHSCLPAKVPDKFAIDSDNDNTRSSKTLTVSLRGRKIFNTEKSSLI